MAQFIELTEYQINFAMEDRKILLEFISTIYETAIFAKNPPRSNISQDHFD